MERFGREKRVWSGRRRLQYQAELSACWSPKCQTIHIHLFGRPQQRGSALRQVQTEMADISAFKRLTAAHKQHANTHALSETPIHTHIYSYLFTLWYGSCTALNHKALQRVVKTAQHIRTELPSMEDLYTQRCRKKANRIIKDPNHPSHKLFCCHLADGTAASGPAPPGSGTASSLRP